MMRRRVYKMQCLLSWYNATIIPLDHNAAALRDRCRTKITPKFRNPSEYFILVWCNEGPDLAVSTYNKISIFYSQLQTCRRGEVFQVHIIRRIISIDISFSSHTVRPYDIEVSAPENVMANWHKMPLRVPMSMDCVLMRPFNTRTSNGDQVRFVQKSNSKTSHKQKATILCS